MAPDREPEAIMDRQDAATASTAPASDPGADQDPSGRAAGVRRSVLRLVSVHGVRRTKHHEVSWG